jgi:hypothetical protein
MKANFIFYFLISSFLFFNVSMSKVCLELRGGETVAYNKDDEKEQAYEKQEDLDAKLFDAIQDADDKRVEQVLKSGADPKTLIDGMDALFLATYLYHDPDHRKGTERSQRNIIKLLVQAGADYNRSFLDGLSTLEFAILYDMRDVLRIFAQQLRKKVNQLVEKMQEALEKIQKMKKPSDTFVPVFLLDKISATLLTLK